MYSGGASPYPPDLRLYSDTINLGAVGERVSLLAFFINFCNNRLLGFYIRFGEIDSLLLIIVIDCCTKIVIVEY